MKVVRTVSEADLARLKAARHDADRRYNEALTALDAAVWSLPGMPAPPSPPDEAQVTPINERWAITRALKPMPGGWRGRLARFIIDLIRPALDQQEAFNAALVDHVNRNIPLQRAIPVSIAELIESTRLQAEHLVHIESRLIMFLQQVTPYIDSKDYEFHGLATRIAEDVAESHDHLTHTVRGLAAALSGVSDDVLKRWERYEGLRSSLATMQMTVQTLRRELAGTIQPPSAPVSTVQHPSAPVSTFQHPSAPFSTPPPAPSFALSSAPSSSHHYVAFEDRFRGDQSAIRERQADYAKLFVQRQDVLDIGCGRGEFLRLLQERGVRARGVDLNHEMVALCTAAGLDVTEQDALGYLRGRADHELGGLLALQVVEHLQPDYLLALLDEAFRVLSPGSPLVLETINVASWSAFFTSYIRDLTHVRPVHPDTLRFLVEASGFLDVEIQFRAVLPESERLAAAPASTRYADQNLAEGRGLTALADTFDRNMARLNAQLYAPLDYAVIAWKR